MAKSPNLPPHRTKEQGGGHATHSADSERRRSRVGPCIASAEAVSEPVQEPDDATSRLGFLSAENSAKVLDHEARDRWQQPTTVVDSLAIPLGARVAEIGAGTGYFNRYFASKVGPAGRVFAQEIEADLVEYMRVRAQQENTPQVSPVLGTPRSPSIPESLDLIFLCNTYRYIDGRIKYFADLRENLAPEGRLVIVGFRRHPSDPSPARIKPERITSELNKAGYTLDQEFDFLPKQYFLVYRGG